MPKLPPDPVDILTATELAELLRVDRKTIYDAASRGDIPHRRLGRRLLFERGSVLAWLRQDSAISDTKRGRDER